MLARADTGVAPVTRDVAAAELETRARRVIRDAARSTGAVALRFSGNHRSLVALRLLENVLAGEALPLLFALEDGESLAELRSFRDRRVAELGARLITLPGDRMAQALIAQGVRVVIDPEPDTAADAWRSGDLDVVWPLAGWTELDVWSFIRREQLAVPSLFLAHRRAVVRRGEALVAVTAATPPAPGERIEEMSVRFRGAQATSGVEPVVSIADTVDAVLAETARAARLELRLP